ncbi:MAG: hypothetical protein WCG27_06295, partial [Pseudomonadota bacterium]
LIPLLFFRLYQNRKKLFGVSGEKKILFLLICSIVYFVLWFIPAQRSQHYAMPAIPFLLALILIVCFHQQNHFSYISKKFTKLRHYFLLPIPVLIIFFFLLLLVTLFAFNFYKSPHVLLTILLVLISCFYTTWTFFRDRHLAQRATAIFISTVVIWCFVFPIFYLPLLPQDVIEAIGQRPVTAFVRRPFFVENVLQRPIKATNENQIASEIGNHPESCFLVPESLYWERNLGQLSTISKKWPVWKRNNRFPHFFRGLKQHSLEDLQENMLLLERKHF